MISPKITEPTITTMSAADYHADPCEPYSITSTALRKMAPPSGCPQRARFYLDHKDDEAETKEFYEIGAAWHKDVLGVGPKIIVVDSDDWRGWASKERDRIRGTGAIPLNNKSRKLVDDMVKAVRDHPWLGKILTPGAFTPELVIIWRDEATGQLCRAMIDAVPDYADKMYMLDLKTTWGAVDPDTLSNVIARNGYHQQFAHYRAGVLAHGIATTVVCVAVFISKEPPHIITYRPLHPEDIFAAEELNARALQRFAECFKDDYWPAYDDPLSPDNLPYFRLPRWYSYQLRRLAEPADFSFPAGVVEKW